jgi:hypothetical protein
LLPFVLLHSAAGEAQQNRSDPALMSSQYAEHFPPSQ